MTNHSDRGEFGPRGGNFIKAETEWGSRDSRSGYIDKEAYDEEEKLFAAHSVESGLNFEKYEDIPVEVSEEMPTMDSFSDCEVHPTMLNNVQRL